MEALEEMEGQVLMEGMGEMAAMQVADNTPMEGVEVAAVILVRMVLLEETEVMGAMGEAGIILLEGMVVMAVTAMGILAREVYLTYK